MIHIEELILENFKSYETQTIPFYDGYNFLIGKNGAGKSTVLEGLIFAFFGKVKERSKQIKIEDLIRRGAKFLKITMKFTLNGNNYLVTRKNYKGSKDPEAELFRDGIHIAEKPTTVTNEIISLIKIDLDVFQNVVHIGQGEIPEIAAKQPGKRKELFDRFLQLNRYEKLHSNLLRVKNKLIDRIEGLEVRIKDLRKDTEDYKSNRETLKENKARLKSLKVRKKDLEKEYRDLSKKLEEEKIRKQMIEKFQTSISEITERIQKLENVITKKQKEVEKSSKSKILTKPESLEQKLSEFEKKKIDTEQKEQECETKLEKYQEMITKLETYEDSLQKDEASLSQLELEIGLQREAILEIDDSFKIEELSKMSKKVQSDLNNISEKIKSMGEKLKVTQDIETQFKLNKQELKGLQKESQKRIREKKKSEKELSKLDIKWREFIDAYTESQLRKNVATYQEEFDRLVKELSRVEGSKTAISDKILDLEKEKEAVKILEDGAKCTLCKQIINQEHKEKISNSLLESLKKQMKELDRIKSIEKEESIEKKKVEDSLEHSKLMLEKFKDIKPIHESLTNNEGAIEEIDSGIKELHVKLKSLKLEENSDIITSNLDNFRTQKEVLGKLSTKLQVLESNVKQQRKMKNEINELQKIIQDLQKQFDMTEFKKLESQKDEFRNQHTILVQNIDYIKELIAWVSDLSDEFDKRKGYEEKLAKELKSFDNIEYEKLDLEVKAKISEVAANKKEIETIEKEVLPLLLKLIEDQESKLEEMDEKRKELEIKRKVQSIVTFLRMFSREITPILRLQHTQEISRKATELFSNLITSSEYNEILITPNYDLLIQRFGVAEDITNLSGGEQVIACLAIRMAIAEVLAKQGLILLDEPTVFLDDTRIEALSSVFQQFRPVKQMIAVTHDDRFTQIADYSVLIEKIKGKSEVRI